MSACIKTTARDGTPTGDITVDTLADGCIGLGFVRTGSPACAFKLPREIADMLAEAIAKELRGAA